ncbi:Bug family tripartite tricarboxylate transporter substrate binding protein [Ramlibacter alkalitolerans]|uniref:Tripartite tricarboxylate transporter substrate binding protein n=1 Tax=Ramlibacter alkalitolerans TaxID=2039631 RepID=A0ABS1JUX5_9BURK|nr:tripartite tricarboxylate transporter substrate binding protein [Ramlibacter alkalitolerans]MBL0427365.1 tripartite tricarboxylate transporter substrate binding protein [Ramlibacter alkalitolerans]
MKRHLFVRSLVTAACAAGLLHALPAAAQNYPTHPVKIIVPFAVGGPADVFARAIAQRLPDVLGGTFVVENKPGAGAVIGTDQVAKSPPDGYTLLLMSNTHTVNETLVPNKPYELLRDFVPVAPINSSDLVLVAHPSVPANNIRELIKAAKEKPGKLTYASSGTGTPYHMAGELFKSMSGTSILHIPYKGSSGARTDVLGGQVNLMFDAVTTMTEQIKAGKVKAIATTGKTRSAVLPEVPTVNESGVPNYEATIWLGLMAPKGTPPEIVNRLNAAVSKIVGERELQQAWEKQGAVPMVMSPQAFDKYVQQDIQKWAKVIHSAHIKAD